MPAATDREAWLLAKHMPLDDIAMRIVEYGLGEYHQFLNPYDIKDLVDRITYAGRSHTMSLMTEIVRKVTGVTVEVKDYDEDEVFEYLWGATSLRNFHHFYEHDNKVILRNVFDSFDEYSDMCRKYLHPMLLTNEDCTRRLLELSISHHNQCLHWDEATIYASDFLTSMSPTTRLTLLGCIPSSSLIVEHDLVQLLVELDDLEDAPMPMVCKSWRDAWYEIYKIDEPIGMSKPSQAADRVEVALNEKDMASWYQATMLQENESRIKVKLLVMPRDIGGSGGDGGEDEMLMIKGRKEEESVSRDGVRPVPPREPSWAPTVGENCEMLYMDGWWPVRVKKQHGRQWHVMYEACNVQHIVGRSELRRMVIWDADKQAWRAAPAA